MPQELPTVLLSPETRSALAAEVDRVGLTDGLTGGLLFGYPLDKGQRLVVSSARLKSDVGFGRRDFSLSQTRTSRQLDHARSLDPKADYCGVWYLHRTPNRELTDDEWVQTQTLLEDPDFPFGDLVCLTLCFYGAELNIYAASFNRLHSARGQAPAPTELKLTTERTKAPTRAQTDPDDWYKSPEVARRLNQERKELMDRYRVEPAMAPNGQMYFRLSPQQKHEKMSFYLACGPGFPDKAPHVFLLVGDKPQRISSPGLANWSASQRLVDLADELVEWLAFSASEYVKNAREALKQRNYREAADLLTVVLAIDPRTPHAARLLARAQASVGA